MKTSLLSRLLCLLILSTVSVKSLANETITLDENVIAGEKVYIQCSGCHSPSYHRTGPRHCGLFGRQAGNVIGYQFSESMRNSKLFWDEQTLDAFIRSPLTNLPGTTMGFVGIESDINRQQLLAYLKTLNADNPLCNE